MRSIWHCLLLTAALASMARAAAPTVQPVAGSDQDAAAVYLRAVELLKPGVESPAESVLEFPGYPPYPTEWWNLADVAWEANKPARDMAHTARALDGAAWPDGKPLVTQLNKCRALANEIGDAALYAHLKGDDASAIESVRDLLHMSDLLQQNAKPRIITALVGVGIRALALQRLETITASVTLTDDVNEKKPLQISAARELLAQLQDIRMDNEWVTNLFAADAFTQPNANASMERCIETFNRVNAERSLAAMSLAAHLFYFDMKEWPADLDDVADYLPAPVALDPWGDGSETLEYLLVKGGLPDGSDRPMVYSRCLSDDGLFYRVDEPEYGFYNGDGSARPTDQQKHGGQFRDVTAWAPAGKLPAGAPTTMPAE